MRISLKDARQRVIYVVFDVNKQILVCTTASSFVAQTRFRAPNIHDSKAMVVSFGKIFASLGQVFGKWVRALTWQTSKQTSMKVKIRLQTWPTSKGTFGGRVEHAEEYFHHSGDLDTCPNISASTQSSASFTAGQTSKSESKRMKSKLRKADWCINYGPAHWIKYERGQWRCVYLSLRFSRFSRV